jgi:hypothetical protein
MLIGLGHLGGVVLELLARQATLGRIIACSRDSQRGEARCNLARLGALAQGFESQIEYRAIDLEAPERVAELVEQEAPDLVLSTATLQTWWLSELLPPAPAARLRKARFGAWLSVHLPLTLELMRALQLADYRGISLTAPFPDVVNCVLGRLGLAPTCGVGNLDEVVPKVRLLAARRLRAPLSEVGVQLVAHHALQVHVFGSAAAQKPPFYLRVEHLGRDVTRETAANELLFSPSPLPGGPAWAFLTAGSTVRLVLALLRGVEVDLHAPAPGGLPGGYPIRVRDGSVSVAPIEGLSLEEAIAINERSHPFDGIERIETDGTVVFVPESVEVMRGELGYDCEQLRPEEARESGRELISRFREFALRHGVDLSRIC